MNRNTKKILFIGSYLSEERNTISIAEKLSKQFQSNEEFNIILVSKYKNKIIRLIEIVLNILFVDYSIAFIDTYSGNSFFIARVASFFLRIKQKKYSIIIRGGNFVNFYNQQSYIVKKVLLRANSILSPSKFIINFFNTIDIEVAYIPNYLNEEIFPNKTEIKRQPYSILWVRAFSDIYNPSIPIKVIEKLVKKYPDVKLTMVGPDLGKLEEVKTLIRSLNLNNHVSIVGSVANNRLFEYYHSHSVYINTTSFESFGMSLLEAANSGIPIVSSNVGEIPLIYEDDKSILLVSNFSITDYASHIDSIFESKEIGEKLAKNSQLIATQFYFEKIKPLWIAEFKKFEGDYEVNNNKHGVLFIGSFLSWKKGTKGPSEIVSKELRKTGIRTKISSIHLKKTLRLIDIFIAIIFSKRMIIHIDVFSGANFLIAKYSILLSYLLRKTVLLNLHGGMLPKHYETNKKAIHFLFKKVNKIFTPSMYLQGFFKEKGFEVSYLPNSVDLSKFPFSATKNEKKILWVRAFTEMYQPEMAVEILEIVRHEFPDATLTMVGPDMGLLQSIKDYIKLKKLDEYVNIVGPVNNNVLVKYYHQHSVFINTTQFESFGVAVLESASSGLPIVSTNVGEIPFLWKHNEDILIDSTNTSQGMANCVLDLFKNEDKRLELIEKAKIKATSFSWDNIEKQWLSNLNELL